MNPDPNRRSSDPLLSALVDKVDHMSDKLSDVAGDVKALTATMSAMSTAFSEHRRDDDKIAEMVNDHDRQISKAQGWLIATGIASGGSVLGHVARFLHIGGGG